MEKEKGGQRGEAVIRDGPAPSRAVSRRWAAAAAPNERTNARTHDPGTPSPKSGRLPSRHRASRPPAHIPRPPQGSARVRAPHFGCKPGGPERLRWPACGLARADARAGVQQTPGERRGPPAIWGVRSPTPPSTRFPITEPSVPPPDTEFLCARPCSQARKH